MPTNRTRRTRSRATWTEGITEVEYLYFAHGGFFESEKFADGKTEDELEALWQKHRSAIMDRYLEENRQKGPSWAGCRPGYFWKELKKPRLKTGTREYYNPWPDREKHIEDVYETDVEFLTRLGLLEGWELEALKKTEKQTSKGGKTDETGHKRSRKAKRIASNG